MVNNTTSTAGERTQKEVVIENGSTLGSFTHLPDWSHPVELDGLTLRQALKELRRVDFGNIGETFSIDLSDGTMIEVNLEKSGDGNSRLMSSQHVRRFSRDSDGEYTIRKYSL